MEVNSAAGLPASVPLSHKSEVPSQKCFIGAAMLPKRVGLPRATPTHSSKSRSSQYGGPDGGTAAPALSVELVIRGTVRNRALAPPISSMPRAIHRAISRTEPRWL